MEAEMAKLREVNARLCEALEGTADHLRRHHAVAPGHFSNAAHVESTLAKAERALAKARNDQIPA